MVEEKPEDISALENKAPVDMEEETECVNIPYVEDQEEILN